jgi:hypothetical protein
LEPINLTSCSDTKITQKQPTTFINRIQQTLRSNSGDQTAPQRLCQRNHFSCPHAAPQSFIRTSYVHQANELKPDFTRDTGLVH